MQKQTAFELGFAYLKSKGISVETAQKYGIHFSAVDYDLIFARNITGKRAFSRVCGAL